MSEADQVVIHSNSFLSVLAEIEKDNDPVAFVCSHRVKKGDVFNALKDARKQKKKAAKAMRTQRKKLQEKMVNWSFKQFNMILSIPHDNALDGVNYVNQIGQALYDLPKETREELMKRWDEEKEADKKELDEIQNGMKEIELEQEIEQKEEAPKVQEDPQKLQEEPQKLQEEPQKLQEEPQKLQEEPQKLQEEPQKLQEEPKEEEKTSKLKERVAQFKEATSRFLNDPEAVKAKIAYDKEHPAVVLMIRHQYPDLPQPTDGNFAVQVAQPQPTDGNFAVQVAQPQEVVPPAEPNDPVYQALERLNTNTPESKALCQKVWTEYKKGKQAQTAKQNEIKKSIKELFNIHEIWKEEVNRVIFQEKVDEYLTTRHDRIQSKIDKKKLNMKTLNDQLEDLLEDIPESVLEYYAAEHVAKVMQTKEEEERRIKKERTAVNLRHSREKQEMQDKHSQQRSNSKRRATENVPGTVAKFDDVQMVD